LSVSKVNQRKTLCRHRNPRPGPEWGWRSPRRSARTVTAWRSCRATRQAGAARNELARHGIISAAFRADARTASRSRRPRRGEAALRLDRRPRVLADRRTLPMPSATELTHESVRSDRPLRPRRRHRREPLLPDMLARARDDSVHDQRLSVLPVPRCAVGAAMAWLRNWAMRCMPRSRERRAGRPVALGAFVGRRPA